MTDNDQAAVEALMKVKVNTTDYACNGWGNPYGASARAILDAIKRGEVPGASMAEPLDALKHSVARLEEINVLRAEVERLQKGDHESCFSRIEAEKARADKAEYERDVANGFIRDRAAERDRLALEVAELRQAQHVIDSSAVNMSAHQAEQQRDRLAGLLREARDLIDENMLSEPLVTRIDAALAEVGES